MREIVIISGKGGTGKTSVCAAFAHMMENGVLCDLDVDAPDLHIIAAPRIVERHAFISGQGASINAEKCETCGACLRHCRFGAIEKTAVGYRVNGLRCEGCSVCSVLCPSLAIEMSDRHCGDWYESESRFGPMFHAQLHPGEENSGRLISLLKQESRKYAKNNGCDLILYDGSPGIGCPVISSLSGAHLAVAVVEPTPSGRQDFLRVAELCEHFRIPVCVFINKADLNSGENAAIRELCGKQGYDLVGEAPFSQEVIDAMLNKKALTETGAVSGSFLREAWGRITEKLRKNP